MAVAFVTKYNPTTNPAGTAISVPVTVAAGDTIVLSIGAGATATVTTAPAGGGLTYTQQVTQNPGGNLPALYMWTATSSTAQTFTLTATMSASGPTYPVTVARYSGVGSIGATGSAHGVASTGSLPSMTLTTTAANSVVSVSDVDWAPATGASTWVTTSGTPTIISDEISSGSSAGHEAYYSFPTAGSKTIGMSAPTGQVWCIGAVELVPSAGNTLTNSVAPAVTPSGSQTVGAVLTTSNGTWSATPDSYTYQWTRGGTAISGATSASYTTVSADAGTSVACAVTAVKATYTSATATSNSVAVTAAAGATQATVRGGVGSANGAGSPGPQVVTKPAGVVDGDYLIAVQVADAFGALASMTAPAGWVLNNSTSSANGFMKVWTKTAASEGASWSFAAGSAADSDVGVVAITAGTYNTTTPLAQVVFGGSTTAATAQVAPTATGVTNGLLLTGVGSFDTTNYATRTYTPPTGMTEVFESAGGRSTAVEGASLALASTAATGTKTATCSLSLRYLSVSIVVNPSSALPANAGSTTLPKWSVAATAAGARTPQGSRTAPWAVTSTAAGRRTPQGSRTAPWAVTATAAGVRPAVAGNTGSTTGPKWSVTATAAGTRTSQGSRTAPWAVTATAAGVRPTVASKNGSTTLPKWSVTAAPTGRRTSQGSRTAPWSVTATPAGAKPGGNTGAATSPKWSATATGAGQRPLVPSRTGNLTAHWRIRGTALASAPKTGALHPTWAGRAAAGGHRIPAGWVTSAGVRLTGTGAGAAPGTEQDLSYLSAGLPRGWRYLAQRLNRDGSPGAWLDTELPLADVQLTDVLSGPTQLQAKITPELQRLIASDGSPLLDEWGTAIYAEADGVIRGGVVLRRSEKAGAVYSIEGAGFSGYAKGMPYEGATQFRNVDPLDVVRHIWDHVQRGQNSNIGMRVDHTTSTPARIGVPETDSSGTAQDKPYELNWWTTDDLGGEIDKLAGDTPFDYHEWHEWVSDHSAVIHHLDFGWPMIGRRRDDLRFVLGENIQVMPAVERDGEDYANHVIVLGAGEGSAMVRGEARVDDGRMRRTRTIDAKALTSVAQAQQLARNEVTLRSQLGTITQVVVRDSPGTRIGSWGPGDEIRLMAETDWEAIDLWFQVVSITYTPDSPDIVSMTLARSGHRGSFPSSVDKLAVQIATIQQQIRDLSRAPQLPTSSIDSGAVTVTTPGADGNPQTTAIIGQQYDGTSGAVTVAGPKPPRPAAADLTAVVGGVEITVSGKFMDPQPGFSSPVVAPMDFAYWLVEVSADSTFVRETKQVFIPSPAGGTATVAWTPVSTPVYARVIARSSAGKDSQPSPLSGPVDSGPVGFGDLGFAISDYAGGTKIYYGTDNPTAPPEGFTPGDMWLEDTGDSGPTGQPLYLLYRWDGIAWKLLQDQGIAQSVAQAIAAQASADDAGLTATQATALADAAQATAGTALTVANRKVTTWYQTAAPTTGLTAGDLWVDTDDGNKLYRYSGTAWVVVQDALMQAAYTAAGTAQATADRKVQTFYRTTAPANPADNLDTGDLWVDTGAGNRLRRWSGTAWVDVQDTSIGTALTNAATAQTTANAKITTWYQSTAPTTGMVTGDLWLDTSTGNKLSRYSGSAWVAVQDAALQTALTNAGTAQATADRKVQTFVRATAPVNPTDGLGVGDLWIDTSNGNKLNRWSGTAWAPYQDAAIQTAMTNAATALTAANSKITTWYQGTAPTTGMVTGDLWLDTANGNRLSRYNGSAWVVVQDAALQSALTAAGTAQATADRKVQTFVRSTAPVNPGDSLDVGDLWLDSSNGNKLMRWSGSAWVAYQDAGIQTAISNAATALTAANGKLTAFYTATAPTTGMNTGDLWVNTSNGNALYRYSGSTWVAIQDTAISQALTAAGTAQATADGKVRIFAQTTAPTGLVAGDVGDMWIDTSNGNKISTWSGTAWVARQLGNSAITPNSLVASNVVATGTVTAALLESMLVLATTVVAGPLAGEHSSLSSAGIQAYANDPSDGMPIQIGQFGRGWSTRNPATGGVVASVTDLGDMSARSLTVSDGDPSFGGVRLMSNTLWNRPWGLVGWAEFAPYSPVDFSGTTTGEIPVWEVAFKAQPGRAYKLCSTPLELAADVGSKGYIRSRRTIDGSTPTISSSLWTEQFVTGMDTGWGGGTPMQYLMWGPQLGRPAETWRILVTIAAAGGSTIKMWRGQFEYFWIEDIGPLPPDIGQVSGGATAKATITSTYNSTWSRSWKAGGTTISFDDPLYQGYGDSVNGRQTSAVGFADVTSVLSGATVNKAELWLYAEQWWNMSGGIAKIYYHGQATQPASSPAMTFMGDVTYTARGQGIWIDVTPWAAQIKSGAARGFGLTALDNTATYYGRMSGASGGISGLPPQLRLTYTK